MRVAQEDTLHTRQQQHMWRGHTSQYEWGSHISLQDLHLDERALNDARGGIHSEWAIGIGSFDQTSNESSDT